MSIIMVDYEDAYARSERLASFSEKCRELSLPLGSDSAELKSGLEDFAVRFDSLSKDIRAAAEVWDKFYRQNIRL